MARNKSRQRGTPMHVPNDVSLRLAFRRVPLRLLPVRLALPQVEDRRRFDPLGVFRPARSLGPRSDARIVVRQNRPFKFPDVHQFAVPDRIAVCVRRQERREVLHAKRKLGRGGAGKRNFWSSISCRRT